MTTRKALVASGLVVVAILAYFAENIIGYHRFTQMCDAEGGLTIHHPLKRGKGWSVERTAYKLASNSEVAFSRFSTDGKVFDARYIGGPITEDGSFQLQPANLAEPVEYELTYTYVPVDGAPRTWRGRYEVIEIVSGRSMIRWVGFVYNVTDIDRSLLANPSRQVCHPMGGFLKRHSFSTYFELR